MWIEMVWQCISQRWLWRVLRSVVYPMQWLGLMINCSMSVRMRILEASVRKMRALIVKMETGKRRKNLTCFVNQMYSFFPLACAEFDDSLLFSGASSISLCYVLFPATFPHQLFFHPLSPHLAIYFLVYLSILLFPNSYIILFCEFYFLPFSVHVQTNVIKCMK